MAKPDAVTSDLMTRLFAYHDSLGNLESRALIKDALAEISRGTWRESVLLEPLKAARGALGDYIHAAGPIDERDGQLLNLIDAVLARAERETAP